MPDHKTFKVQVGDHGHLPIEVVAYAIASLFNATGKQELAIEDLMYGNNDYPAPGAVFCLTESDFLYTLEKLEQRQDIPFKFQETAGVRVLYKISKSQLEPMSYLQHYYEQSNFLEAVA